MNMYANTRDFDTYRAVCKSWPEPPIVIVLFM